MTTIHGPDETAAQLRLAAKAEGRTLDELAGEGLLAEKAFYTITMLCRVLEVSRSGFHAWCKRAPSLRIGSDALLAAHVAAVHKRSRKTYGSPRVHADTRAGSTWR